MDVCNPVLKTHIQGRIVKIVSTGFPGRKELTTCKISVVGTDHSDRRASFHPFNHCFKFYTNLFCIVSILFSMSFSLE